MPKDILSKSAAQQQQRQERLKKREEQEKKKQQREIAEQRRGREEVNRREKVEEMEDRRKRYDESMEVERQNGFTATKYSMMGAQKAVAHTRVNKGLANHPRSDDANFIERHDPDVHLRGGSGGR